MEFIPEGYLYCNCCCCFTRHVEARFGGKTCAVCGTSKYGPDQCDHCGYEFGENINERQTRTVKLHRSGCHCGDMGKVENGEWVEDWDGNVSYDEWMLQTFICQLRASDHRCHIYDPRILPKLPDNLRECGCPEETVYEVPVTVAFSVRPGDTFVCVNAMEWDYSLRCPICGHVSEFSDGNC